MIVVTGLLGLILAAVIFKKVFGKRFFAYFFNNLSHSYDDIFGSVKRELFKPLHSIKSSDGSKKENEITILEVGVGTGNNLMYYPNGTKLIVIEPNPHMKKYYESNLKKYSNISSEEIISTTGEEMDMIKSNSVDAVVITHVLCSTINAAAILRQVHRVLRPGGKFFFIEHIQEFDDSHYISWALQHFFMKTYFWPYFLDDCHLTRNCMLDLKATGFSHLDMKRIRIPIKKIILKLIEPHLVGVATK